MSIYRVCVYCASSRECDDYYYSEAEKLGRILAKNNKEIIYGGGNAGLMKYLADGALAEGGRVIGIIPDSLHKLKLGHKGISELRIVDNLHVRKKMFLEESDCIVALPGGCGTIEELMEAITWKQLNLIRSPIIIVNLRNYYRDLISMLNHSFDEKFMHKHNGTLWKVASSIEETMDIIDSEFPLDLFKPSIS